MSNLGESIKRFTLILVLLVAIAAGTFLIFAYLIAPHINLPMLEETIRLIIIISFWLAVLFIIRRTKPTMETHIGSHATTIVQLFVGAIAVLVLFFLVLGAIGVSPQSLLTGAGFASITIGLIISTFVGGILAGALVFTTHKFRVGDTVIFNNIPGRVTELTALVTRIRTDLGNVTIPNSAIASGAVIITRVHMHEATAQSRMPYGLGDRVVTTYMQGEGTVKELTAIHTVIALDSGREIMFLNSTVLSGSVAVAKVTGTSKPQPNPQPEKAPPKVSTPGDSPAAQSGAP